MAVTLRPLDLNNLAECLALEVTDAQRNQAQISETPAILEPLVGDPTNIILTIYSDETMVGFVACTHMNESTEYEIMYFLIDKNHQRKGYGTRALRKTISFLCGKSDCERITIRYMDFNVEASALYSQAGFIEVAEDNSYVDAVLECSQYSPE